MEIDIPKTIPDINGFTHWCNKLTQYLRRNVLQSSSDILVSQTTTGTTLTLAKKINPYTPPQQTGGSTTTLTQLNVVSIGSDYVLCKPIGALDTGSAPIYVAKPYKLRMSLTSENIAGTSHVYTYAPAPSDAFTGSYTRTDSYSGMTEAQQVIPPYLIGDVIYGMGVDTYVPGFYTIKTGSVSSGGSGYAVNDQLTTTGGAPIDWAKFVVTSVDALGSILGFRITGSTTAFGKYSALPPNPDTIQYASGGGGTGATFNLVWNPLLLDINADGRAWAGPSA